MAYRAIGQIGGIPTTQTTSLMAKKGLNFRDLPQLLTPDNALIIDNYIITAEGGLAKRQGLELQFDDGGVLGGTMLEEFTEDVILFGVGTSLKAFQISTGVITDIKTDFNIAGFSGARYGGYFFVASPGDKIGRVTITLSYDAQTVNFTIGTVVTGVTSGATATILEDDNGGTTGILTLGTIQGVFQDGELITDTGGGSADVDGALFFAFTSIAAAPIASIITVVDTRLFAGRLADEPTALQYSEVDDGSNPPFDSWTVGTLATDGGEIFYRNAGNINVIANLGSIIIVFADDGKWAFRIDTIDSGGVISKVDTTLMYRLDEGGDASLQTKEGLFYVNSQGLWQLVSVGQDNIRFSDQEQLVSTFLGNTFFNDIDFSQASIAKSDETNTLLITCARDSEQNNFVITYNTALKAFATITGWNHNRYLNIDGTIFGIGSLTAKMWEVFEGFDDDGNDIWTEFKQELNVGDLNDRKNLLGQYVHGQLSASTTIEIAFDIFDRTGNIILRKAVLEWCPGSSPGEGAGYGRSPFGQSPWGGDIDLSTLIEDFNGQRVKIANFQRIRVGFTEHSKVPHIINYITLLTQDKVPIRRRKLVQIET